MRDLNLLLAAFAFAGAAVVTAQSKELVCADCHPAQARSQPQTSMARALIPPGSNQLLVSRPKLTFQKGSYAYSIETHGSESIYSVSDSSGRLSVPIAWTFGVGSQTYVYQRNGKLYESFVSYYPLIDGLDVTMGDQNLSPGTLDEALGRELSERDAKACFGCHSTGAVSGDRLQLNALKPGVTCQHCHTSASAHLQAIAHGKLDSVPKKLGRMSAEDISNFCGQCHRSWETVVRNGWRGEINVRFQPYRLAISKCFDGADPRISCIACHDPHQEVVRRSVSYDTKCFACHSQRPRMPKASTSELAKRSETAKSCPVAKENCANCHMPQVNLPGGHQEFADHDIRVVHPGEPYPN